MTMMRAAIFLFLAIGSATAQDAATADKNAALRDLHVRVDKVFARWDSTLSPGCALSVVRDGQIVYKRGDGMADLDHEIPINSATVFHVASISNQGKPGQYPFYRFCRSRKARNERA